MAPALYRAGCRQFFIAHLNEGIALRPLIPDDVELHVLHGAHPGAEGEFVRHGLRPVLNSLQGKVLHTRSIAAGTSVGYAHSWTASRASRIATVAVGYADGYLRGLSNRGVAHCDGIALSLIGNISMDTLMVDITDLPDIRQDRAIRARVAMAVFGERAQWTKRSKCASSIPCVLPCSLASSRSIAAAG